MALSDHGRHVWLLPCTHPPPLSYSSHDRQPGPSPLLVVICLTIVHRLRPQWLAVTISDAAREQHLNAERVSRLCSRARPAFEATLGALVRVGRPPRAAAQGAEQNAAQELAVARSLLAVASSVLEHVSLRAGAVRPLILGAWLRLWAEHPSLTQKQFCHTLALSPRTLRSWRLPAPAAKTDTGATRTSIDTQLAADTTELQALRIRLKLIASQDIGRRDQDLLDSIIVDDQENAERVVAALKVAINEREGFQVLVDQGTPYMAEAIRIALQQLGAEHAPHNPREHPPTSPPSSAPS